MKKIFTLIIVPVLYTTGLFAQATPNAGFENWTTCCFPSYSDPDDWESANSQTAIIGQFGCVKATGADVHSGTAAVKLITKNLLSVDAPGVVTTGTLPTSTGDPITGGIPYTLRPDSIAGWYKYTPQGGDNGFAEFMLFGSAANNADTVAKARFETPSTTVSAYTRFSAPLVYFSTNAVANSIWLLSSSKDDVSPVINSMAFFDDLELIINPVTPVSVTITSSTNVLCNGNCTGSATATLTGGTSPFTYQWSNAQATSTATGLCAGTYTVTVTDAISGTATTSVTITQPATAVSATATATPALCNGTNTGTLSATGSGGTAGYSYSWSGGLGSNQNITNVPAGTYTVTVTDANNCTSTVTASVTQPTALTVTTTKTDVSCNGESTGTATITVAGGTPGYSYSWSNGQTGSTVTGLVAGTYTTTVTDVNTCTQTGSVTISQPVAIVITVTTTDASCGSNNGTATASASGGTGALTYQWSNGATTQTTTGLAAGVYYITVVDGNGCMESSNALVNATGGATLTVTSKTNVSCNGGNNGEAAITATGGTPPYTYLWSDPFNQSTPSATGLYANTYVVTVTDNSGCQSFLNVTITEPQTLSVSVVKNDVLCYGTNNGSATATYSGGTPPYTYSWSNGDTTVGSEQLAVGSYTITVTDSCGGKAIASATIIEPAAIITTLVSTADSGSADGTATVLVSGGTTPYTYQWSDSNSQTTTTATGLASGKYFVTVTDGNGCIETDSVQVSFYISIESRWQNEASGIKIYPNPAGKIFFIAADNATASKYEIKIIASSGQILRSSSFYHAGGSFKKEVAAHGLSNGLLMVQMISDDGISVFPLLKVE
ncbi:MAG: hypothetical protein HYY40_13190 [Bacteroidetes bacterium]|nr:hypothetical protein [Bacteroidota bacterium]